MQFCKDNITKVGFAPRVQVLTPLDLGLPSEMCHQISECILGTSVHPRSFRELREPTVMLVQFKAVLERRGGAFKRPQSQQGEQKYLLEDELDPSEPEDQPARTIKAQKLPKQTYGKHTCKCSTLDKPVDPPESKGHKVDEEVDELMEDDSNEIRVYSQALDTLEGDKILTQDIINNFSQSSTASKPYDESKLLDLTGTAPDPAAADYETYVDWAQNLNRLQDFFAHWADSHLLFEQQQYEILLHFAENQGERWRQANPHLKRKQQACVEVLNAYFIALLAGESKDWVQMCGPLLSNILNIYVWKHTYNIQAKIEYLEQVNGKIPDAPVHTYQYGTSLPLKHWAFSFEGLPDALLTVLKNDVQHISQEEPDFSDEALADPLCSNQKWPADETFNNILVHTHHEHTVNDIQMRALLCKHKSHHAAPSLTPTLFTAHDLGVIEIHPELDSKIQMLDDVMVAPEDWDKVDDCLNMNMWLLKQGAASNLQALEEHSTRAKKAANTHQSKGKEVVKQCHKQHTADNLHDDTNMDGSSNSGKSGSTDSEGPGDRVDTDMDHEDDDDNKDNEEMRDFIDADDAKVV
ncbi:hypothetical protein DACRYDRAFT_16760 [Dacryopinax primogenitus]|uniref:Uncharacterized protein n=1 Tax=Dacryopinax primogenitus (strain DJM 731) TaxID=1858805 RepID=M5G2V2_DACPD|nr:uncharacterized protein DACRYDRAFT_16760 [Dacryopinax primogenitus]EJU00167.1 hypothetical protein DACRYDRAFT_16760 [Dacryopinax primogenitus]